MNRAIRFPEIRVIGPDGDQLGVMTPDAGRAIAAEHGLDLVEVAPNTRPPVCRVMDYGRFKYRQSKREQSNAAKVTVKTIKLRPKTDDHDLDIKLGRAREFLERGDKVRLVMRLRGRERGLSSRWVALMGEHAEALANVGTVASRPNPEGPVVTMLLEPQPEG